MANFTIYRDGLITSISSQSPYNLSTGSSDISFEILNASTGKDDTAVTALYLETSTKSKYKATKSGTVWNVTIGAFNMPGKILVTVVTDRVCAPCELEVLPSGTQLSEYREGLYILPADSMWQNYIDSKFNQYTSGIDAKIKTATDTANEALSYTTSSIIYDDQIKSRASGNYAYTNDGSSGNELINCDLNANRFAGLNGTNGASITYTTDGETWTDYTNGVTDSIHYAALTVSDYIYVSGPDHSVHTTNCKLRIEIDCTKAKLYGIIRRFHFAGATQGSTGCYVIIERWNQSTSAWELIDSSTSSYKIVSSWPSWDYVIPNKSVKVTYDSSVAQKSPSEYTTKLRLTFGCTGFSGTNGGMAITAIRAYGTMWYSALMNAAIDGRGYTLTQLGGMSLDRGPVIDHNRLCYHDTSNNLRHVSDDLNTLRSEMTYATTSQIDSLFS